MSSASVKKDDKGLVFVRYVIRWGHGHFESTDKSYVNWLQYTGNEEELKQVVDFMESADKSAADDYMMAREWGISQDQAKCFARSADLNLSQDWILPETMVKAVVKYSTLDNKYTPPPKIVHGKLQLPKKSSSAEVDWDKVNFKNLATHFC